MCFEFNVTGKTNLDCLYEKVWKTKQMCFEFNVTVRPNVDCMKKVWKTK